MPDEKNIAEQLAEACGGTITEVVGPLPDGSGFAIMSMPLKKTHWIYNPDDSISSGPPPMVFRMGANDQSSLLIQRKKNDTPFGIDPPIRMTRKDFAGKIREAGKYAVRSATMCGREMDFDPDALLQNLVVGFLGYWTEDGLSNDDWDNPPRYQKQKEGE